MGAAQLPAKDIPAAFAEDGPSRESIVRAAIERAKAQYRVRHFERIVSVGDAVWDVRAARRLQLPFVGVGTGQRAVLLREEGASVRTFRRLPPDNCGYPLVFGQNPSIFRLRK